MPRYQRFKPRYFFSFLLASSLFSLGCTSTSPAPPEVSANQVQASSITQPLATYPSAQITRLSSGALHFSMAYPLPTSLPHRFQTQALNYPDFARFQVTIIGIGLTTPLYPATANSDKNNTLPALCDTSRCDLQTRIENVPAGENRVALITAYDSEGLAIPGSTLAAAFTLPTDPDETLTVNLSYLSTPVGQIVQSLLEDRAYLLVSQLDSDVLQNFITLLTGASGHYPDFSYTRPPSLIDIPKLAEDIKTNGGDIAALDPANPDYLKQGAVISGSISGLVGNDKVKLRLTDPTSPPIFVGNGPFTFENVPAGDWQVILENTQGYQVANPPGHVTVAEGQTLPLLSTTLSQISNAPPVLVESEIQPGGNIVLQGRNFNPNAASNSIVITGNLNSGGFIVGYWTVNATDITEENGLYSVAFPLPTEITGKWFNLRISDPTEPIVFHISSFHVTSLDRGAAMAGETILINGAYFDPLASNHQVVIAGRTIPTANLTVLSDSQMEVLLPTDLPVGDAVVEVSKSGAPSSYSPWLTLLSQPKSWSADWSAIPGTAAEHVLAVASSSLLPKRVWFGSKVGGAGAGGIWVCDTGSSTSCLNPKPGSSVGSIQAFAQAPDSTSRVYAGSETQGFLLCPANCDQGANWKQSNFGLNNLNVRAIVVDPHEPQKIYAATASGVYRSQNSGGNWSAYNAGLLGNQQNVHSLSIYRPTILAEPVLYMGTAGAGVLRKIGAADWGTINTGIFSEDASSNEGSQYLQSVTISALEAHPTIPGLLYGGGTGQHQIVTAIWKVGIWQRSETGSVSNWMQLGRNGSNGFPCPANTFDTCLPVTPGTGLSSMQVLDLAVDPAQSQHIYATTRLDGLQAGGVYRSTDAGVSWEAFNVINGGVSLSDATVLAVNHLRLYAGTPQGLFQAP